MNKLLFALSLAKKSGKLVVGFDAVKSAVILISTRPGLVPSITATDYPSTVLRIIYI